MARGFDDPTVTRAYTVRHQEQGSTRWKTAGRTWTKFSKAIDYAHGLEKLPSRPTRIQVQMTETIVQTVLETPEWSPTKGEPSV